MCRCVVERHRRGRENRTVAVLLDEDGAAAVSVPALDRYDEIDRLALPGAEPFQNANDIRIGPPAAAVLAESHFGQLRDRKRVVWGTSVSVRVVHGGRRIIKKKK